MADTFHPLKNAIASIDLVRMVEQVTRAASQLSFRVAEVVRLPNPQPKTGTLTSSATPRFTCDAALPVSVFPHPMPTDRPARQLIHKLDETR